MFKNTKENEKIKKKFENTHTQHGQIGQFSRRFDVKPNFTVFKHFKENPTKFQQFSKNQTQFKIKIKENLLIISVNLKEKASLI